jgi:uncharacterized protein (TIRG00374 family)
MKPLTKRLLNLALIIGTFVIVLIIGFQDNNLADTVRTLTKISIPSVVICVALYLAYVGCDCVSVWYFLRRQGYKISLPYVYFTSIAGQYYSNITPGATGGQPMQIYYLHQRGIPAGVATSALITRFFSFQFMLFVLGTLAWVTHRDYVRREFDDWYWALIVGYIWNVAVCGMLLTFSFFRPAVRWIVNLVLKLGAKLHLIKNPDKTGEKWMRSVDSFHNSMRDILKRPVDMVIQLLIGGIQLFVLMCILWFIYQDIGNGQGRFTQIVTLDVLEYTSAAYTPLPGASGAQEGVFALFFAGVMPGSLTVAGMLAWRFLSFYSVLAIGLVVYLCMKVRTRVEIKHETGQSAPLLQPDFVESGRELIDSEDSTETNE